MTFDDLNHQLEHILARREARNALQSRLEALYTQQEDDTLAGPDLGAQIDALRRDLAAYHDVEQAYADVLAEKRAILLDGASANARQLAALEAERDATLAFAERLTELITAHREELAALKHLLQHVQEGLEAAAGDGMQLDDAVAAPILRTAADLRSRLADIAASLQQQQEHLAATIERLLRDAG